MIQQPCVPLARGTPGNREPRLVRRDAWSDGV
jgi:hypothetical protein